MPKIGESRVVRVDELSPYPGNARRGDLSVLRDSLRVHGQYRDIVVQESTGYILAGNHTFLAAQAEGWSEIGATFIDVEDDQARKIVLVDNRSNDVAGYDLPALADLLKSVDGLEGTGFDDQALEDVMASLKGGGFATGVDPDYAPSLPSEPDTVVGDLYTLGDHRLLCGDSTEPTGVDRLLDGASARLLFTDPPYNLDFKNFRLGKHRKGTNHRADRTLMNDSMSSEGFEDLIRGSLANAMAHLDQGSSAYVCTDWRWYPQLAEWFRDYFSHKSTVVWNKGSIGIGVHYRFQYELVLFGCLGDSVGYWYGGKGESDVWEISRENKLEYKHVTQKPVALADRAISNSTRSGDNVLDLFGGSGTTLISCEGMGRNCYMMELDPAYCDVIVSRWEKITGKKAVLNEAT